MTISRWFNLVLFSLLVCAGCTLLLYILFILEVSTPIIELIGEIVIYIAYVVIGETLIGLAWRLYILFRPREHTNQNTNEHNDKRSYNIASKLGARYSFYKVFLVISDKVSHMNSLIKSHHESKDERNKPHSQNTISKVESHVNHNRAEPLASHTHPPKRFFTSKKLRFFGGPVFTFFHISNPTPKRRVKRGLTSIITSQHNHLTLRKIGCILALD
jgi:hypothetical protein